MPPSDGNPGLGADDDQVEIAPGPKLLTATTHGIPLFNNSLDGFASKLKGYSSHPLGGLMGYTFAEHVWLDA